VAREGRRDPEGTQTDHRLVSTPPPSPLSSCSQLFDDVWTQFTKLGSPVTSSMDGDGLPPWAAASGEFETPSAAATTRVLVVGATGRVGRVLVRKLLLRGYRVTALVRPPAGVEAGAAPPPDAADAAGLPPAARVVYGDVGDYASLAAAVALQTRARGQRATYEGVRAAVEAGSGRTFLVRRGGERGGGGVEKIRSD